MTSLSLQALEDLLSFGESTTTDHVIAPRQIWSDSPLLGEIGTLQVRLAHTSSEIEAVQKLRQRVFRQDAYGLDRDRFDAVCDHLLVTDTNMGSGERKVVGTYRMLRDTVADAHEGFYSAQEYDIAHFRRLHAGKRLLELGRSCVLEEYRTKRTVELLWQGIWAYVLQHKIDLMFGCASFEGTDVERHAEALSFLHANCAADPLTGTSALPHLYQRMDLIAPDAIDARRAFRALPPLIKGYLRVGARIGDGAVIDHEFGTTDVMVIMPITNLNPRYVAYYGQDASRYAPRPDAGIDEVGLE
jgi:L-ornithine Nalpha-acyltransferase